MRLSKGLTGAGGSTPKVSHTHGWQAGVGWLQEASLTTLGSLSVGLLNCPHNMIPMSDQEGAERESNVFYVLMLELMLHDFHRILLFLLVCPIPCGRALHKGMDTRSHDHGGPWWRLVTLN